MDKSLNRRDLSAYHLKWIAMLTMTLDHFGRMFGGYWIIPLAKALQISEYATRLAFSAVFSAGHITIYIFMWFIAEGCRYTHNIKAYIGRLLLFGLLSEIPYQLMIKIIKGDPLSIEIGFTNVMFTFALGALACYSYKLLKEKGAICFLIPIILAVLAYLLHTDYDYFGVLCIFVLYFVEDQKKRLNILTLLIILFNGFHEPLISILTYGFDITVLPIYALRLTYALLSVLFLSAYHGKRGKSGKMGKYLFYAYYPVHITALILLFVWLM